MLSLIHQHFFPLPVYNRLQERSDPEQPQSSLEAGPAQSSRSLQRRLQPGPQDRHLRLGCQQQA